MGRFFGLIACSMLLVSPGLGGELPTAEPTSVGLSAEKMAAIEPALEGLVKNGEIAGAVAVVVREGKVAGVTVVGLRDIESKAPMTEDTIFAIASMSKPITCVGAMRLVEQGKIALDDPAAKYLPELSSLRVLGDAKDDVDGQVATVELKFPLTIRDLFAHTSGFTYSFLTSDERLRGEYIRARAEGPSVKTIAEQVERLARVPLAHQPGESWTYGLSNDVLGRVIEVVSGQPLDQYLEEHVLRPLDMKDTSFLVPKAKRERVATIYRAGEDGQLTALPNNYGSATFFAGGAGLFSTARDYARFAQMLASGGALDGVRILESETLATMTTDQLDGFEAAIGEWRVGPFGLGFGLSFTEGGDPPVLEGFGWGGLFSTNFRVEPPRDLVLVYMTQVLPTGRGGGFEALSEIVHAADQK